MKKLLIFVAGLILFLLLNVIGGVFYHPFHIETALPGARSFAWDGILFMLTAWFLLLLLLVGAARKRFTASAVPLTMALVLAVLAGFFLKLGFATHQW
jgi:hypothetical protein